METAEVSYCVHLTFSYTLTNVPVVSSCTVSVCTRNACVLLETTTVVSRIVNIPKILFFGNKIRFPWLYFTVILLPLSRTSPFFEQIAIPVIVRNSVFHCTCFSSYPSLTSEVSQMSTEKVKNNYVNIICWSLL